MSEKNAELRKVCAAAIGRLRDQAIPVLDELARRNELSAAVIGELRAIYETPQPVMSWQVVGPFPIGAAPELPMDRPIDRSVGLAGVGGQRVTWRKAAAVDSQGQIDLSQICSHEDDRAAYGHAEIPSRTDRKAEMVVGSDDTLTVWLNGREVYKFDGRRLYGSDQARFEVSLRRGSNRIVIRCGNGDGEWKFSVALTAEVDLAFLKAPREWHRAPRAIDHSRSGRRAAGRGAANYSLTPRGWRVSNATRSVRKAARSGLSFRASERNTRATN